MAGSAIRSTESRVARGDGASVRAHVADVEVGLRQYQTMFERGSLAQFIVTLPSFRIGMVNNAMCRMTGFGAEELIGAQLALIYPADQSPVEDILGRLADGTCDGYSAERVLQRRDGSLLQSLSTASVVRDNEGAPVQLLILMQDRTEKVASDRTQRLSQRLISAAIAALPVAFSTFDRDLRLSFVVGGREQRGMRAEDYLGKHISEITADRGSIRAVEQALAGSESTSRVVINRNTYLALNAPMRDDRGNISGVISVSSNITAEVSADTKRKRAEAMTRFVARHDPLTGLLRRSGLVDYLEHHVRAGRPTGGLLMLDLDDFNIINDSLGHEVGDAVLMAVAGRVTEAFPGLVAARCGADEFAVLAPFVVDKSSAAEAARRICAILDGEVIVMGHAVRVSASLGIALEEACMRDAPSTLLRNADSALSHAKSAGLGEYRLYNAAMRRQVQDVVEIQDGLRAALADGGLRVAYQPIVDLASHRILGVEALLRWTHPERGAVAPATFIPIAEQCGLIVPIGEWVMNAACDDSVALRREQDVYISVNVSTRQLVAGGFAEWVEEVLARTGIPAPSLMIEVTESALMHDIAVVRTAFDRLRSRGVKIALDDFGTGYSSLARLQRLQIDVIKLDRVFVHEVDTRPEARAMAAAIFHVSTAIGATIVAEGVETESEVRALLDLGYTSAQGYLFARPMPIDTLMALVRSKAVEVGRKAV